MDWLSVYQAKNILDQRQSKLELELRQKCASLKPFKQCPTSGILLLLHGNASYNFFKPKQCFGNIPLTKVAFNAVRLNLQSPLAPIRNHPIRHTDVLKLMTPAKQPQLRGKGVSCPLTIFSYCLIQFTNDQINMKQLLMIRFKCNTEQVMFIKKGKFLKVS